MPIGRAPSAASITELRARIDELQRELDVAHLEAGLDPLTGLANRRSFDRAVARAESQADREGSDLGVIALDIDGLKVINDRDGHDAGDGVLLAVAAVLHRFSRAHDLAARLGGDEFAILAHTDTSGLTTAAARLRRLLNEAGITASIGWAMRDGGSSVHAALAVADRQVRLTKCAPRPEDAAARALEAGRAAASTREVLAQATGMVMHWQRCSAEQARLVIASHAHRERLPVTTVCSLLVAAASGARLSDDEHARAHTLIDAVRRTARA